MKRLGAVALALLYALPATWALQGGIDLVRPARAAVAADGTCASHGCGCEESAKVRKACCCAPVPGAPAPASALEASRCSGTETASLAFLTPPVLPPDLLLAFVPVALPAGDVPTARPIRTPQAAPPDKVPIA